MRTDAYVRPLIRSLVEIGAINVNIEKPWRLKDGSLSPIYINLRLLQSFPVLLHSIAASMMHRINDESIRADVVSGIPQAGIPLGVAFSLRSKVPHIMPRMKEKTHGLSVPIDGVYKYHERALVIDDLVTTGLTKDDFINFLCEKGLTVRDVLVVLDRQQGGEAALRKRHITLHPLLTMDKLLKVLREIKHLSVEEEEKLRGMLHLIPSKQ